MDVIARKCYPFTVDFSVFHAASQTSMNPSEFTNRNIAYRTETFNKYLAQNVRRHLTSRISDSTVIGSNSEIKENSVIEHCVIGDNCKIG